MRITNPNWWTIGTVVAITISALVGGNLTALWAILALLIAPTLIAVPLMLWNRRQDARLAADFPHDPIIQRKYGKR